MAMISKKGVYGLSAMYILASSPKDILIHSKELATKAHVPHNFLEQILIVLKKENFVKSIRGKKGGYKLARDTNQISVYEILNALESCISCISVEDNEELLLPFFWNNVQEEVKKIFNLSLEELIEQNKTNIIYYI